MEKNIFQTIKYFSIFDYYPSFEEIYKFFPKKITREKLKQELKKLVSQKKLFSFGKNPIRYTIGEYSIEIKNSKLKIQNLKFKISQKKLNNLRFKIYIKFLSFFPQIKLIGLSGSVSMMNAKEEDDIDLFIITAKNRLFTGRIIALFLAEILGIRRKFTDKSSTFHVSRFTNKVCLNLFFDEKDLAVPKFKRSLYVGHEVLQMKPIINKDQIYEKFLEANLWVKKIFPNAFIANSKFKIQKSKVQLISQNFGFLDKIFSFIEYFLKEFQLFLINRHKTTEIITDTQLWFHPDDFEKKIKF